MTIRVLIRGGGDLASGVALRLFRAGMDLLITELPQPLAVRRKVAFSSAIIQKEFVIEGIHACRADTFADADKFMAKRFIAVMIDPEAKVRGLFTPDVLVDARMIKSAPDLGMDEVALTIGLGPGFEAGVNCHVVIETKRGPTLGRVFWKGKPEEDTGIPESVGSHGKERVLRTQKSGVFISQAEVGGLVKQGEEIGRVAEEMILAPFDGLLRGLLPSGTQVEPGMKIGDVDPRLDERLIYWVSDKALAIGGGVLEAVLSSTEMRKKL